MFTSIQEDDGFVVVGSRKREIKTCKYCGDKSNPGYKPRCDCKEIIGQYGDLKCKTCKKGYALCMTIHEYIKSRLINGDKEYAFIHYGTYLNNTMSEPCSACSPLYKKEYSELKYTFEKWREWYIDTYGYPEDYIKRQLEDDCYDEPCRAHRTLCPCCGDCP